MPAVLEVMTLAMLTLLVLPLWLAIDTIADHADQLTAAARSVAPQWHPAAAGLGRRPAAGR